MCNYVKMCRKINDGHKMQTITRQCATTYRLNEASYINLSTIKHNKYKQLKNTNYNDSK